MILRVIDEQAFNLSMSLNINYERGYIEVSVSSWNKKTHKTETKTFAASEFSEALTYYYRQADLLAGISENEHDRWGY